MPKSQHHAADFILKPGEIKKMIWVCDDFRDRCIVKTLAYTGMRREELQQLDVQDLDFERSRIHIRSGKGGKSRVVIASQSLMADLKHLVANRNKGALLLSQKKGRISSRHINRIVNSAGLQAGIKHPNPKKKAINPHLLRHSWSRNALAQGMRIEYVQQQLGHASIKTTMDIYGTPPLDEIQASYEEKIEGVYG